MNKLVGLAVAVIGVFDVAKEATATALIAGVIGVAGIFCIAMAWRSRHD